MDPNTSNISGGVPKFGKNVRAIETAFAEAMRAAGIEPPQKIEADGRIHRFSTNGRWGDDAGWYVLYADNLPAGAFGCWRSNISEKWRADFDGQLSPAEATAHQHRIEQIERQREADLALRQIKAAEAATKQWETTSLASENHQYLVEKGIKPCGARLHANGGLVIPMRNAKGEICSLQFIAPNGDKRFLTDGRVKGCFCLIGQAESARPVLICEGFATGATIHEATQLPTAVAFTSGNLTPVARALREKHRDFEFIMCADDDVATEDNPGSTQATAAALAVNAKIAVPNFGTDRPDNVTDFNDMAAHLGLSAVADAIASALPVPKANLAEERTEPDADEPVALIRQMPPPGSYPVDGLGSKLALIVRALHEILRSPLAMCANSVLAAIALVAQAHINVELPIGSRARRPVSNYFVTVGRSGERKSATDGLIMASIKIREEELRLARKAQLGKYRDDHEVWTADRRKIVNGKGNKTSKKVDLAALGPEPTEPLLPLISLDEPTTDGLAKLLMKGQPSVGLFSTEGGEFIGGHAMKDDAKLRSAAALSKLWDGEAWTRVRSGDGSHTIADKRFSMHLMAQPDVANLLMADPVLTDQGLTSRFLVTAPRTTMGTRFHREPRDDALTAVAEFNEVMTERLAQPYPLREKTRNDLAPRVLRFLPEARRDWLKFSDDIERLLTPGGELEPITGFAAKMAEHAARLAAVITWWHKPDAEEIDAETLAGAIELVRHYGDEALRLQQAAGIPGDIADAQRLLDWLKERWSEPLVSISDIVQLGPNSLRVARRAKQLVRLLEQHGWLVKEAGSAVIRGQRRRDVWRVVRRG